MADPREARLPKWAQDELAILRRDLESVKRYADELRGHRGESDTYVQNYLHGDYALPARSRIAFHLLPDDGRVRRSIKVHVEDGVLNVQGDDMIDIRPQASNSLTIKFRGRW